MKTAYRIFASGVLVAALTLPGIASAQGKCAVVRSIMSEDSGKLEGIGVTTNSQGLVDATHFGTVGIIRDAKTCQIDAPEYGFDLDCNWYFQRGEERKAQRQFDALRRGLDDCLPGILEKEEPVVWTDAQLEDFRTKYGDGFVERIQNRETLEEYGQSFELTSGDEVDIDLNMTQTKDSGRLSINFNIYRD